MSIAPEPDLEDAPAEDGRPDRSPSWPVWVPTTAVFLFLVITWQVTAHGPLARADERLSRAVARPDRVSGLLADLGNVSVAVPVLAAVLVYVAWRAWCAGGDRWWVPSVAAAVLMAVVPALIIPLKEVVARPGPLLTTSASGFYPSGHTATAAIAYGSAAMVLWPWLRTAYARRELVVVCLVLNLGVAFGLVRHGYHWPLDVLASWCLCAMLLTGLALFLDRDSRR